MRITVKAKPGARENRVEEVEPGIFSVVTTEPPVQGRANTAIIALLAEHFGVPKLAVRIVQGWTSRTKVVDVVQ